MKRIARVLVLLVLFAPLRLAMPRYEALPERLHKRPRPCYYDGCNWICPDSATKRWCGPRKAAGK